IDQVTGIAYLTEDREDGLLYRFIPEAPGELARGGMLEALAIVGGPTDTRHWDGGQFPANADVSVRWIPLDDVEATEDDLRVRRAYAGAALFARGEVLYMGEGELYLCCTTGGAARTGQIFRLRPDSGEGTDLLDLFYDSAARDAL